MEHPILAIGALLYLAVMQKADQKGAVCSIHPTFIPRSSHVQATFVCYPVRHHLSTEKINSLQTCFS
jgi:hypothetical protein